MDKLNKYIIVDILDFLGYWIEIVRLERVCMKWKAIIKSMPHRLSLQGYRSHPNLTASNVDIKPILESPFNYNLTSVDLRNVTICPERLGLLLLTQMNLKKLNLTNAYIDLNQTFYLLAEQKRIPGFQLEELRLSNFKRLNTRTLLLDTFFPKLKRLYISNISLNTENFRTITSRMRSLRLLDISFNPITENDLNSLNLSSHLSNLEQIFFPGSDEEAERLTKSTGIKLLASYMGCSQ